MNDLLARLSACEVMTTPVIAVGPSRDAREAAWITVEHRIGALPVLEAGRLAGIVTETGLLRVFAAGG
jgi:CBS domain-containing protein